MVVTRASFDIARVDTHHILSEIKELHENPTKLPHQRTSPLPTAEL